ncbi:MAG: anaerobic sulfatase maturase [Candidatus Andeanibacterium colombiense]|uniref:Anaerobic sulfatase maturase n=1 Tax=Candidatus Andeanibacterium colombiense TaxID=3121345 RepID=A0AAJ5X5D7_9SPHN|nr:MAG: anaerobic sulfatase maturase [Sphingomonadaceae bacterium]
MTLPSIDRTTGIVPSTSGFHAMAKPSGPACNLDCSYCFYLEKEALFPGKKMRRMSDEVLEAYVRNTIASTPRGAPVMFTWQGGEPTLLGLDFYRRAVALQKIYAEGRRIDNGFQTNGTLIDDEWAAFLAENEFLVGLSLDGPREIHDRFRRYRSGAPTFDLVMAALERLQRHEVEYNVLACVDGNSAGHPLEIYRFLKAQGVKHIQFTPVIERLAGTRDKAIGLDLSGPDGAEGENPDAAMAPFSVKPAEWGSYLSTVFEEWSRRDVGEVFVMNFEWTLAAMVGAPGVVCVHQPTCGRAVIAEHDGTVYSCDHFVYPEYRLGNIVEDSLAAMVDSTQQQAFGRAKHETLPTQCRKCPYLELCWGGCPKHRFARSREGEPGLNYLCEGYIEYFAAAIPKLAQIARLLQAGRDPAESMSSTSRGNTF